MVPGAAFYPNDASTPSSFARACFSTATPEAMEEALGRLAELLEEERERRRAGTDSATGL